MKHRYSKSTLPSKICPICNRPFTWRKKWEREWENVRYCSERCRRAVKQSLRDVSSAHEGVITHEHTPLV
ncbi:MAG TPA: hypothetical protein DIS79_02360 [Bacteroidetes bacterium]|nr:hypothetical protein [Bacteroidota bacterium]HRK05193.1 DUF2256 domain-containing protein [Chlorobiota bacterium]